MSAPGWLVVDPFVCSDERIVGRNFKSKASAERWLRDRQAKDDAGYAGCLVVPISEKAEWSEKARRAAS